MSINYHGPEVTAAAQVVPLTSIPKRYSKNLDFVIKVLSPIELTDGEHDIALEVTVNCLMDGDDIARLGEFKHHTVNSCAVSVGNTDLNVSDDEAASIFAEFYSVARADGTFPNRIWLLELCRRANGE